MVCRSTYARSARLPFYCRPVRTTSLLGDRLTLRPSFIAGLSNSYCPPPATSRGSSIRRGVNMATGRTKRTRRPRRSGSPQRHPSPIPGGRNGRAGSRNTPGARCRRGTRATAGSNRSRTPPAPTSRCAPPTDRIRRAATGAWVAIVKSSAIGALGTPREFGTFGLKSSVVPMGMSSAGNDSFADTHPGRRNERQSLYWRSKRNLPQDFRRGRPAGDDVRGSGRWRRPSPGRRESTFSVSWGKS
jgi:hypothetical protein